MAICTADDIVQYAGLSEPDWELLDVLAARAQSVVEQYCRCAFEPAEYDELYDIQEAQSRIVLRRYPVVQVTAVYDGLGQPDGGRQLSSEEYVVDEAGILRLRNGAFTSGVASVRVVYTAGYQQVPAPVQQAAIMIALDWYHNRPDGRAVRESFDGYAGTYSPDALPQRVRELLNPYRRRILP